MKIGKDRNEFVKNNRKSKIVIQFALGVVEENLFALFQRKKFGTKNPTAFSAGTPTKKGGQAQ